MATYFDYTITLRDSKHLTTTLNFDLGEFALADAGLEFIAALSAATQIRGALVDITTAFVSKERLIARVADDNQVPAAGVADITDEAFVSVHLAAPTELRKLAGIRIPAPIAALFLAPEGVVVNVNNALLQAYVEQLSEHALISDGETINLSTGTEGIDSGYWRSRAKRGV